MSLFRCCDLIEKRLSDLNGRGYSVYSRFLTKKQLEKIVAEKKLIEQLNKIFHSRIADDRYTDLATDLARIRNYEHEFGVLPTYLNDIVRDLEKIDEYKEYDLDVAFGSSTSNYQKYQKKPYLVARLNQSLDFREGLDEGNCLGYTYAMIDPELSPYHAFHAHENPPIIHLNQKIYNYQKNQSKPQENIKRKPIVGRRFCSDVKKQAEEIYSIAQKYQGKEFEIFFQNRKEKHATYISIDDEGRIRFMEPNYGAYCFEHVSDFCDFYSQIYADQQNYKFYSLYQITYIPHSKKLNESLTWDDAIQAMIYGPASEQSVFFRVLINVAVSELSTGLLPWVLTLPLVLISPMLGLVSFLVLSFALTMINLVAVFSGYQGLLGSVHFLQECWYDYKTGSLFSNAQDKSSIENAVVDSVLQKVSDCSMFKSASLTEESLQEDVLLKHEAAKN